MKKLLLIAMLAVLPVLSGCRMVDNIGNGLVGAGEFLGSSVKAMNADVKDTMKKCSKDW